MAENLNYDIPNNTTDVCYNNSEANCATYGRLYNWGAAGGAADANNPNKACPVGWHLPDGTEWTTLINYVGSFSNAGTILKSSQYWNYDANTPTGTDDYGFSALPGGYGSWDGSFSYVGSNGYWWSWTGDPEFPAFLTMQRNGINVGYSVAGGVDTKRSVRCVQD
jgi:uncharacterized protein (TIGR02145 family)